MSKEQLKIQIDTDITNKTSSKSISPLNVGKNMKDIVDLISEGSLQDLQSVLDKGNVTTKTFYNEFDAGSGNYLRTGVIPFSGTPFPILGQAVNDEGQLIEMGIAPLVNGMYIVYKTGVVNKKINFAFPDKPNDSYPTPSLYTLATTDQLRPYKVYTALLNQSGTSVPVATVLENTLGGTIVWSRVATGDYTATLNGVFTLNKTIGFYTRGIGLSVLARFLSEGSTNTFKLQTYNSSNISTDGLAQENIEIRVYN